VFATLLSLVVGNAGLNTPLALSRLERLDWFTAALSDALSDDGTAATALH
jgi:hypothetical protein